MFFRKDVRRGDYPSRNRPKRTHSANHSDSRRRAFEHLEDRRLMAVDFASVFTGGSNIADVNIHDSISDLVVDSGGNTLVVGRFAGTVDFAPGAANYELTSTSPTIRDDFVAKYDPSGGLLWAQAIRHDTLDQQGRQIAVDGTGNVFVAGSFAGSADFGSYTLSSLGNDDVFLIKLDANGNFAWAKQFGTTDGDIGNGVAVDNAGNAVIIAQFHPAPTNADAYVAKVDPFGNTIWSRTVEASSSLKGNNPTGWAAGTSITVDNAGAIYAVGNMGGTVDFDPSAGTAGCTTAA